MAWWQAFHRRKHRQVNSKNDTLWPFMYSCHFSLVVPENVERFLWKPSTYIYDLKNLRHSISLQNDHTHFCKVYNSENMVRVSISDRFEVDITCGYNHTNFPFDTQFCLFRFGVQNYPIEKVRFARVTLHDFTADHDPAHQAQNTKLAFTKTIKPLGYKYFDFGRANYSYNGLSITFDRNIENYIYAYYGPLFLFVIMSWFSFVISFQQVHTTHFQVIVFTMFQIGFV